MKETANCTIEDVHTGLANLRRAIINDVLPVVEHARTHEEVGFFIVPREVFAHIDFLGALYSGYRGNTNTAARREIASSRKATAFIEGMLGEIDPAYQKNGALAYEMFRHGTIHLFRPHRLRRADGATIEWLLYKGDRKNAFVTWKQQPLDVSHLEPLVVDHAAQTYLLPLSINCLYQDLMEAIDLYEKELTESVHRGEMKLLNNFASTVAALADPEPTKLNW